MDLSAISRMAGAAPIADPVTTTPVTPDDLVVERFQQALDPGAVPPAAGQAQVAPVANGETGTVGHTILNGLDDFSGRMRETWAAVQTGVNAQSAVMGMADLVKLQTHVVEFSVLFEVVGKGIQKAVADLESTVKMQ